MGANLEAMRGYQHDAPINVWTVIGMQSCLLLFLQYGDKILPSNFAARKACHAGNGALIMMLDSRESTARYYVYTVIASSLAMTWRLCPSWVPAFRFGDLYDAGITIYLLIVGCWFHLQLPVRALAPLFFADPAGAVVGKFFTRRGWNRNWYENKSVAGTLAVLGFAFASLDVPSLGARCGLAVACALAEAFGGKTYDNLVISIPVLGSWVYYHS